MKKKYFNFVKKGKEVKVKRRDKRRENINKVLHKVFFVVKVRGAQVIVPFRSSFRSSFSVGGGVVRKERRGRRRRWRRSRGFFNRLEGANGFNRVGVANKEDDKLNKSR